MKVRFLLDEDGQLVDRDGHVLGRLVSIVLDLPGDANSTEITDAQSARITDANSTQVTGDGPHPGNSARITGGLWGEGVEVQDQQQLQDPQTPPVAPRSLRSIATQAVWEHYVTTCHAERQALNPQRRRIIENALKTHSVEECCEAITGLSRSPHHNGENDQHTKYLDIRYALRGNGARGESTDERIAKMIELASLPAPETPEQNERYDLQRELARYASELAKLEGLPEDALRPGDITRRNELRARLGRP